MAHSWDNESAKAIGKSLAIKQAVNGCIQQSTVVFSNGVGIRLILIHTCLAMKKHLH